MDNILSDKIHFYNCNELMQLISSKLRQRRLSQNLTQLALAKKSGVTLGSLKRFEKTSEISIKNFIQLIITLELSDKLVEMFNFKEPESIDDILSKKKNKKRLRGRKNV